MAHMSREFSLVLLGAAILTTGHFVWPEEDMEARANQMVAQQVVGDQGNNAQGRRYHGGTFIWLHASTMSNSPVGSAKASMPRGGFGGMGRSISAAS